MVERASSVDRFGLIGSTLAGRYHVERQVAEGGFAVVYRAYQALLESIRGAQSSQDAARLGGGEPRTLSRAIRRGSQNDPEAQAPVVSENSSRSRSPPIVVVEQAAEPSPALHRAPGVVVRGQSRRSDDPTLQPLVVALAVIVRDELVQ